MADDLNAGGAGDGKKPDSGDGTDPDKNANPPDGSVDFSKVGDDAFSKVFDDPRLWNHPRFKSLRERAKKAEEIEAAEKKREEERLKKQGEFQKLAETKEAEAGEWKTKYTQQLLDNKISVEAARVGVVDIEAALKLIDRSKVAFSDDGTATGIPEAVGALLTAKPYLKGEGGTTTVGSATNPGAGATTPKKFKMSQLQDAEFYQKNEKDIREAMQKGQIEMDMPGMVIPEK